MSSRRVERVRTLRTEVPTPYMNEPHLFEDPGKYAQFNDHDGGPLAGRDDENVYYEPTDLRWVVAPELGSGSAGLSLFTRRYSNKITFAPGVHLALSSVYTSMPVNFDELFLVDVDRFGKIPAVGATRAWVCTFRGKLGGITTLQIRIRVSEDAQILEGYIVHLPRNDYQLIVEDFPAPAASQMGFSPQSAICVNDAFLATAMPSGGKVDFSIQDEQVNREGRVDAATRAWELFKADVALRSASTVYNLNNIRKQVALSKHFRGMDKELSFWDANPNEDPK